MPYRCLYTNMLSVGHTKVRCTQPAKEADTGFGDGYGAGSGGGFDSVPVAGEGGGDWAPTATDPIAVGGGSSW